MKEYAIGEEFEHEGKMLVVVESDQGFPGSGGCFLCAAKCIDEEVSCYKSDRTDGKHVHFEEVKA